MCKLKAGLVTVSYTFLNEIKNCAKLSININDNWKRVHNNHSLSISNNLDLEPTFLPSCNTPLHCVFNNNGSKIKNNVEI